MTMEADRYEVRKDGAKGLSKGFLGWSSNACAKKLL